MSILGPIASCVFLDLDALFRNNLPVCSSGATLTLAHGRRYGLIGRNGTELVIDRDHFRSMGNFHRCWQIHSPKTNSDA
jgi:hypothetical protein